MSAAKLCSCACYIVKVMGVSIHPQLMKSLGTAFCTASIVCLTINIGMIIRACYFSELTFKVLNLFYHFLSKFLDLLV